jgi:hypothetical protein
LAWHFSEGMLVSSVAILACSIILYL